MVGIKTYFDFHYLTVSPSFYLTPQMPRLFIEKQAQRERTCPRTHSGSVAEMDLRPRLPAFFLWPLQIFYHLFPKSISLFFITMQCHLPGGLLRKTEGIWPKVCPAEGKKNKPTHTQKNTNNNSNNNNKKQDFDVLQLVQRCVENANQMFGLRIQNKMYLTFEFRKLNSNMYLVGFPENIDSCSIKLNKHQPQCVVSPPLSFPPFLRVSPNYFQTLLFSKLETFHMFGLHEANGSYWLMPQCTADTPYFIVQPSGSLLRLFLCLVCFPSALSLSEILLAAPSSKAIPQLFLSFNWLLYSSHISLQRWL